MNLETLVARLDVLESQDAIRALKAAYMQGCDDRKGRAIADLFWDDGVWEGIGGASGLYRGHEEIAAMFEAAPTRLTFTTHYLTNETITVKGDTATGQWKLLEPMVYRDTVALWMGGRYVDEFTRRDGEWRFSHLKLDVTFRTPFHKGWHEERFANLAAYDAP
ncbi:MAG TPA: nuclear transport factor 2 family protein [Alphaproteobacteria bacterium]|nr:nuclear transport factor 2 family protein [Alphaproteobacteria bacterium]